MCTRCDGTCGGAASGGELTARQVREIQATLTEAFESPQPESASAAWSVKDAGRVRNQLRAAFDPNMRAAMARVEASMWGEARQGSRALWAEVDCLGDPSGLTVERLSACRPDY